MVAGRFLRSAQTFFPFVRPLKFEAYNLGTRLFGWRIPLEFRPLQKMKNVGLALDIGANWGQSIHALRWTAHPKRIVSFEPNKVLASRLERRFKGSRDVEVRAHALSDQVGTFPLFVPRYRAFVYDGLAALSETDASLYLNAKWVMGFDADKLKIDRQDVAVARLDDLDLSPDVVKIDVQGAEYAVVKGGAEMFRRCRPVSIIEAPSPELVALFDGFGMKPYRYDGTSLRSDWQGSANVLFLDDARHDELNG